MDKHAVSHSNMVARFTMTAPVADHGAIQPPVGDTVQAAQVYQARDFISIKMSLISESKFIQTIHSQNPSATRLMAPATAMEETKAMAETMDTEEMRVIVDKLKSQAETNNTEKTKVTEKT